MNSQGANASAATPSVETYLASLPRGLASYPECMFKGESLDAIMRLLRREELVTMKTDWFELKDAQLQLASYSEPHLPVSVAASFTPAGPMAGQWPSSALPLATMILVPSAFSQ